MRATVWRRREEKINSLKILAIFKCHNEIPNVKMAHTKMRYGYICDGAERKTKGKNDMNCMLAARKDDSGDELGTAARVR